MNGLRFSITFRISVLAPDLCDDTDFCPLVGLVAAERNLTTRELAICLTVILTALPTE